MTEAEAVHGIEPKLGYQNDNDDIGLSRLFLPANHRTSGGDPVCLSEQRRRFFVTAKLTLLSGVSNWGAHQNCAECEQRIRVPLRNDGDGRTRRLLCCLVPPRRRHPVLLVPPLCGPAAPVSTLLHTLTRTRSLSLSLPRSSHLCLSPGKIAFVSPPSAAPLL